MKYDRTLDQIACIGFWLIDRTHLSTSEGVYPPLMCRLRRLFIHYMHSCYFPLPGKAAVISRASRIGITQLIAPVVNNRTKVVGMVRPLFGDVVTELHESVVEYRAPPAFVVRFHVQHATELECPEDVPEVDVDRRGAGPAHTGVTADRCEEDVGLHQKRPRAATVALLRVRRELDEIGRLGRRNPCSPDRLGRRELRSCTSHGDQQERQERDE